MEDLIKGIIDVAVGHLHQNRNQEQDDDGRHGGQSNSESREDRSRSTWAEVVSTGTDDDGVSHQQQQQQQQQQQNRWNRKEEESENDKWEAPGHGERQSRRRPQQEAIENDEWETVGEKPSRRRPQKEEEWQSAGEKHSRRRPQKVPADHWQTYKRPLAEQQYKDDVEYGADIEPSEEELAVLSQACSKLWELDSNRLVPGQDYQIDCGEGKKVYQNSDMAEGSLFDWVNEDIFRRPTYSRFCSLLDNYNPHEGFKEVVTNEEQQEQAAFIEEISRTAPIKYLHKYLTFKGVVSKNYQEFKKFMIDLWFRLYGRGGTFGSSSAFEHVFVGEIKQREEQEVSGFHNWLQFYLEESKGRVDYQGYIFPRRRGQVPDSETQLLTIQFKWNGILKSVSSTLVGVSPEFEVALYTLCFFMGEEDNHVEIGPYPVNIKCYRLGRDKIGSAFPIAEN